MEKALGLIEMEGLAGAIAAVDAALKAAKGSIIGYEYIIGPIGLVTVKIEGDVASIEAAIAAGKTAAERVGHVLSARVIPKPDVELRKVVRSPDTTGPERRPPRVLPKELYTTG